MVDAYQLDCATDALSTPLAVTSQYCRRVEHTAHAQVTEQIEKIKVAVESVADTFHSVGLSRREGIRSVVRIVDWEKMVMGGPDPQARMRSKFVWAHTCARTRKAGAGWRLGGHSTWRTRLFVCTPIAPGAGLLSRLHPTTRGCFR